ncbi:PGPGW domain-containing protein [Gammaproteobacteria bacterium]|nr:PGPGW domain-containing protein [Gammaproteobacteria bacterium]
MLPFFDINTFTDNDALIWTVGLLLFATFVASLIIVPWIILNIPADYFCHSSRHTALRSKQHPVIRILLLLAKNILGGILVLLGIAMLVLPGQGLLTILMGIILLDFPGKYQSERWFISRKPVLLSVNWLRKKRNRDPLELD